MSKEITGTVISGPYRLTHRFERVEGGFRHKSTDVERLLPFAVHPSNRPKMLRGSLWVNKDSFPSPPSNNDEEAFLTEQEVVKFGVR